MARDLEFSQPAVCTEHAVATTTHTWLCGCDAAGEVARLRAQLEQARAALAQAEHEAHTDPLTGLWNRRHARAALEREAAIARRAGRPFAVLLLDIDHFKAINDGYGHEAGDRALEHVAGLIARSVRESDLVARWGGEEFLVLCPAADTAQATTLAERLRREVAAKPAPIGRELHVPITCSLGVATWAPEDADPDATIARADRALYAAKAAGRNCSECAVGHIT